MNYWAKVSIAAAIAAGLIGLYFLDVRMSEKKEEAERTETKVLSVQAVKMRSIALENSHGKFVFERDNEKSDWRFSEPSVKARLDQDTVAALVSSIENMVFQLEVPDSEKVLKGGAEKKKDFGLDVPRISVEITLDDKSKKHLYIGADMDIGTKSSGKFEAVSAYASSDSHPSVLVVSAAALSSLKKGFEDFRTKMVADFKSEEVKSVSVKGENGSTILVVKGEKDWQVRSPRELLADSNNVSVFLNTLSNLKVEKVTEPEMLVPERLSALGLDKPAGVVELKGAGDKVLQTFSFGKTNDALFVTMSDGAAGNIDKGRWKDVVPALIFFRDKRVLRDASLSEIVRIRTQSGKVFQKEGGSWYSTSSLGDALLPEPTISGKPDAKNTVSVTPSPVGKAANTDAAALFNDWEFMTAEEILEGAEASKLSALGLDKPRQRFWFEYASNKQPAVEILVGNKVPNKDSLVYVKRSNGVAVFAVSANWLEKLTTLDGGAVGAKKK